MCHNIGLTNTLKNLHWAKLRLLKYLFYFQTVWFLSTENLCFDIPSMFFSCNLCIAAVTVHLLAAFLKLESNFVHPTLPVSVLKCTTLRYFTVADVCTRRRLSCYVLKSTHVLSIQITYGNPYSQWHILVIIE